VVLPALIAACLMALGLAGCGGDEARPRADSGPVTRLELERAPYIGVSCPEPNSIRCDTVGLAVWLRKPARRLEATIEGRALAMRSPGDLVGPRGRGWEGYLKPAGLIDGPLTVRPEEGRWYWTGRSPVHAVVRLTAHYRGGRKARTRVRVFVSPGWG
jgi:hypothetical protein